MTLTEAPTETPPGVAAVANCGEWIWLDGDWRPRHEAPTLPLQRGVHETVAAYEGATGPALFRLDAHLERLERSCRTEGAPWQRHDHRVLLDAAAEALSLYRFGSGTVTLGVVPSDHGCRRHLVVSAEPTPGWRRGARGFGAPSGCRFGVTAEGLVSDPTLPPDELTENTLQAAAADLGLTRWASAPTAFAHASEFFTAGPGVRVVALTWSARGFEPAAEPGPWTRALAARLTALATGAAPDVHRWLTPGPRWQSVLF